MIDKYSILFDSKNRIIKKSLSDNKELLDELFSITSWLSGDVTISERVYVIRNNIYEVQLCNGCMKNYVNFISMSEGYTKYCSRRCSTSSSYAKTEKKIKFKDKYGVDNPSKLEEVKRKKINTLINNYGVTNPMHSTLIKDKLKNTNIKRYGIENTFQLDEAKESNRKHNVYAFSLLSNSEIMVNMYSNYPSSIISGMLGVCQSTVGNYLREYGITLNRWNRHSYLEKLILQYIKDIYPGKIETNIRGIIDRLELDIYIPEKKLAIEINGVYWHSTKFRDKNYHLNKTIECENRGIQLLHIFENELYSKLEVWKSVIANKLGLTSNRIHARKCIIKEVSVQDGKLFFEENHIQGGLNKGKHIGLYIDQELVSCLSYGASRFKKDEIEIYRFANKLNTNVVGGFSRLLKQIPFSRIISYANRRWSTGLVYEKNGFELVDETPPNYFYYKNGEMHSRQKFQKHKLKSMLSYSDKKTEEQIMDEEGYLRIYDCGNLKYVYKNEDI